MTPQDLNAYLTIVQFALSVGLTTAAQVRKFFGDRGVSNEELNTRIRAVMADADARRLISELEAAGPDATGTP